MAADIFMSYSRREVGFVDDLTHRLEKAGFNVWLDYRRLIPGTPWAGQIDKGLKDAEVILLVVSKDSIASQYVELEWRHVLEEKHKRIILAIFEAVDLPPELEKYEWVDFRGNYEAGLKELIAQLNTPIKETHPVPETGFKMPPIVWVTAGLALLAGFVSLFTFYTVLIPMVLVPLAWRVLRRDYNYSQTQLALWTLPVAYVVFMYLMLETGIVTSQVQGQGLVQDVAQYFLIAPLCCTPLIVIPLILLLRSAGMQRWGKPEANRPKFANPYRPNNPNPKPVTFHIDHAPQDRLIASHIAKGLTKYGHQPAADLATAQAVFVLISCFKTDTDANPEKQTVLPVLVQTAQPSEKLSHVQWIDFRRGVRNLDAIAQLLPEPAKMLSALGVRPMSGAQVILPGIINAIVNYLTIFIVVDFSLFVTYIFELFVITGAAFVGQVAVYLFQYVLAMAAISGLSYAAIRALTQRRGWLAAWIPFGLNLIVLFFLGMFQSTRSTAIDVAHGLVSDSQTLAVFGVLPFGYYMFVGIGLGIAALFQLNDLRRWFPSRAK
jgi:hypothetical protein